MKIRIVLILGLFTIFSGCKSSSEKTSKLRIGQFLFSESPVEVSFSKKAESISNKSLEYGKLTDYENFEPGTYSVEIKNSGKLLLKKKIGIGTDGRYTLIINGIPKENQKTNEKTANMKLHEIVEGEEAIYANGNLPQMRVINDEFEVGKEEAKIRWVHLAAGITEISGETKANAEEAKSLSKLTYPKISKNFAVALKEQEVTWKLKGGKVAVATEKINPKPRYLYTCFIIGNKNKYLDSLKVVVGETPKKGF
ncbi:DUF4397 domain-containing protein [Christiangramia aestuarii]|uniref:DUF4397 domain-containing protein n=1 Tax=Christiangramia aestuarii TaxID=1028746 RepID=A0A7K1LRD7_9FLAO|nr:DUF4397 domain-containing protein [Christiangramia aestuarii]MUP43369.1 DUF4397 domain-containing protein [Christiangramia aestuarii]